MKIFWYSGDCNVAVICFFFFFFEAGGVSEISRLPSMFQKRVYNRRSLLSSIKKYPLHKEINRRKE